MPITPDITWSTDELGAAQAGPGSYGSGNLSNRPLLAQLGAAGAGTLLATLIDSQATSTNITLTAGQDHDGGSNVLYIGYTDGVVYPVAFGSVSPASLNGQAIQTFYQSHDEIADTYTTAFVLYGTLAQTFFTSFNLNGTDFISASATTFGQAGGLTFWLWGPAAGAFNIANGGVYICPFVLP